MTNEEAIKMLISKMDGNTDTSYEWAETVRMAIKALEQQTSEDCVSRQAVLAVAGDSCLDLDSYEDTKEFCDEIKDLPPVTSTHGTCKECKQGQKCEHGIYCTNLGGTNEEGWYCADFEKRGNESEICN